jgi:hypothetical protein
VTEGDVLGGEIWGVTAAGSLMASTFWSGGATFREPSISRDLVADGVMGGECIGGTRGLCLGDGRPEELLVL